MVSPRTGSISLLRLACFKSFTPGDSYRNACHDFRYHELAGDGNAAPSAQSTLRIYACSWGLPKVDNIIQCIVKAFCLWTLKKLLISAHICPSDSCHRHFRVPMRAPKPEFINKLRLYLSFLPFLVP